jgi:hypothetical protein
MTHNDQHTTPRAPVRRTLWLAIDDHALPLRRNLHLCISRPAIRAEPVLAPRRDDPLAPDQIAAHFYGTVLQEGGRFRMWYYPVALGDAPGTLTQGPIAYAESDDGLTWQRPILNQIEFRGSRANNAIALPETRIEGVTLIRDDDDPDPARRYKLVYNPHTGPYWSMRTATSADGLHWTPGRELVIREFLEQASFYHHDGLYIVNAQTISPWRRSEGGGLMGRQAYAWVSSDFDHWIEETVESFTLPEPADHADRGLRKPYDQVHIGIGAASFGSVCVGLFGRWHNHPDFHQITCDLSLVVSNDGLQFREPAKGHVFIAADDAPAPAWNGTQYPTILAQGNGILNVGDETRIYFDRWRNAPYGEAYYGDVALATLPRDRWGYLALNPDPEALIRQHGSNQYDPATTYDPDEGVVWTAPFVVPPAARLVLNIDGGADCRIAVADSRFRLLAAYSGAASGHLAIPAGLDCPVHWPAAPLAALAGQTVRLRISMRRQAHNEPRLYAVELVSE